ncbi:hypothetical protein CCACVL1_15585 [Corchorus capsularis]|uniref:Protein kinase domain-containing protein n=1 Tax=Corchorus capsularis TaxID=210143 RepID=A0A1R3I1T9_COCAP|nr:hypothetical protein CCACVL1_15585 [Corchorus capsularis]
MALEWDVAKFEFGERFRKSYNDISYLAKGGCGAVFSCKGEDDKKYAVKICNVGGDNPQREAIMLEELKNHSSIVHYEEHWLEYKPLLYDGVYYGDDEEKDKSLYLVMELCRTSLLDLFERGEDFDCGTGLRWFKEIIEGLVHIHKKDIIHGDITSANVFLDDLQHVKIGDFGFGRGTSSDKSVGDDIFRAGCIFVEILHPTMTDIERYNASGRLKNSIFPEGFKHDTEFLIDLLEYRPRAPRILEKLNEAINAGGTDDAILSRILKMVSRSLNFIVEDLDGKKVRGNMSTIFTYAAFDAYCVSRENEDTIPSKGQLEREEELSPGLGQILAA